MRDLTEMTPLQLDRIKLRKRSKATLVELKAKLIMDCLIRNAGNQSVVARELQIDRNTVAAYMRKWSEISSEKFQHPK